MSDTSSLVGAATPRAAPGGAPPENVLKPSSYDGIQEYDNPMPAWWTAIFWGTILFSLPYFFYYQIGVGPTLAEDYEGEVGAYGELLASQLGNVEPTQDVILTLVQNDPSLKLGGQALFRGNCATCHGPEGGGRTGPNLTDDSYINVKKPEDIFRVLHDGVVSKGMPEWGKRFSKQQLILLSSYVASLRGTKPAEAKEAQGTGVDPWPAVQAPPKKAADTK